MICQFIDSDSWHIAGCSLREDHHRVIAAEIQTPPANEDDHQEALSSISSQPDVIKSYLA